MYSKHSIDSNALDVRTCNQGVAGPACTGELGYIRSQPTADEVILRSLGVSPR